jgi:hypothetical protein
MLSGEAHPFIEIVGCPRSGTTLIRNMLNAHPEIFIFPESQFINKIWGSRRFVNYKKDRWKMLQVIAMKALNPAIQRAKRELFSKAEGMEGTFDDYFREYVDFVKRYNFEKKSYVGDKTPRHALFLREIADNISLGLKIIVIARDSRAVVASLRLRGTVKKVEQGAATWNFFTDHIIRMCADFEENEMLLVRYEDVVSDPRSTALKLSEFLGLEYTDQMLDVRDSNSSYGDERRQGIYKDSLNQWTNKLTHKEIDAISFYTKKGLCHFDYDVTKPGGTISPGSRALYIFYGIQEQLLLLLMRKGIYPTPALPSIKRALKHPLYTKR